jgi:polysaccharide transporter, PST family
MADLPAQTASTQDSAGVATAASRSPQEESQPRLIPTGDRTLREHAARGTLINAGFDLGLAALGLARRLLVAIFLTTTEYGLWGLIFVAFTTLLMLSDVGVGDRYVQQDEEDQEAAFQKAFTVHLVWQLIFFLTVLAGIPLFALLYGRPEIIAPAWVLSLTLLASIFQSPTWVFYREMRFARQRFLTAVDPVVGLVVTVVLAAAGAGVWSLVLGFVAGAFSAALAAVLASPYPLRIRMPKGVIRDYWSFSWPLLLAAGSSALVVQGAVTIANTTVGLAGLGAIGLASNFAFYADKVDSIVTQTLYPAICAVRDRVDLLFESFVKSNRLALIWGLPFGVGLSLFAADLVHFVLGDKWHSAIGLLQVFGILAAIKQVGFSWTAYHRAVGDTRPIAANSVLTLVAFAVVGVPAMLLWGLTGYAVAMIAVNGVQLLARTYFLSRLFAGFKMLRHLARAVAPSIPAVATVLGIRVLEGNGRRPLSLVLAELALYALVTAVATWVMERDLLREAAGYLRPARQAALDRPA